MEILNVQHLSKTYGSGETKVEALRDVSFSLEKGEFAAVIGESGSGKSTLLNCIGGLDMPSSGKVLIDGQDLFAMGEEARTIFRRRSIGFVFQSYQLVPELDVEQNIIFPLLLDYRRPKQADVDEILEVLGLAARRHHLPSQLSGGQQQRVAIARALCMNPEVMYFDEATSALDPKLTKDMHDLIRQLAGEGMAVGIVTHEMGFAETVSDRICLLFDGQIVEDGTPHEVMEHPKDPRTRAFLDLACD